MNEREALNEAADMPQKQCYKCKGTFPLQGFYPHAQMADGRLNQCKECSKRSTREHRAAHIERYRAYDRQRGSRATNENLRQWRSKYPERAKAYAFVSYEIRAGRLEKAPCVICGAAEHVHGHHDNYARPLDVTWLCAAHHRERHKSLGWG